MANVILVVQPALSRDAHIVPHAGKAFGVYWYHIVQR